MILSDNNLDVLKQMYKDLSGERYGFTLTVQEYAYFMLLLSLDQTRISELDDQEKKDKYFEINRSLRRKALEASLSS